MNNTQRLVLPVALAVVFAWAAPAAELEGVLIDRMCSVKTLQEGGHKAATMHPRDCALMPDCVKSGYGMVTADNRFIAFDAEGNKKVEKALKGAKRVDSLRIKVSGEQSGDTIQVKSLKLL